jgi:uncharacterized protein YbbC (DUF1343 family)
MSARMHGSAQRYITLCSLFLALGSATCAQRIRPGAEVLLERHMDLLAQKRVGVIGNQTSVLPDGTHLVDTLIRLGVDVTALFSPEHGIRGDVSAGEQVADTVDRRTGLPVYSLYGRSSRPTPEMLRNVDLLVFDLQDVGARFYTYASTMAYVMAAAAGRHIPVLVLDRPNPIDGTDVEGPLLDTAFTSFVGLFPIPVRHGMTLGELAGMIAGERWLAGAPDVNLRVIPMEGWKRTMWYDDTGLIWIPPSPNMKTLSTATVYPGTCLVEGTNVSEGRGTDRPFEYIGAPWIDGDSLSRALNALRLPGVHAEPITFTPAPDARAARDPKFRNELCGGVYLHVLDRSAFRPVSVAIRLLSQLRAMYAGKLVLHPSTFDHLAGNARLRSEIESGGMSEAAGPASLRHFLELRKKYLLYP